MSATKNSSIPRQKANGVGLDLLHERPATRGTVDLVLSDATKGIIHLKKQLDAVTFNLETLPVAADEIDFGGEEPDIADLQW